TGFYRTWGRDTLILEAFEDGYFPYYEEIDMSTMAPGDHDILMEELVDFDILVNGTLRDQDYRHIPGTVWIYDRDHPGFLVAEIQVNSSGEFSFYAYYGNFTATYNNATLQDEMDFQVDGSDQQFYLLLIPRSRISGTVLDLEGSLIGGVHVSLLWVGQAGDVCIDWMNTSVDGTFEFAYQEGVYRIVIRRSELYNRYEGPEFHVDGWEEHNVEIVLENRTLGNISGRVYGEGGFFEDGVPWAVVTLHHGDMMVMSTQADRNGDFLLWNISDGYDYTLTVAPADAHRAVEGTRSGYLDNSTYNISMYGYGLHLDIYLPYQNHSTSDWLEFLLWSPIWSPEYASVPLDEPIHIQFSMPVNRSTVVSAVDIDPAPADMSYVWNAERTILRIDHDPFDPMTNYSVSVKNTILSEGRYPLLNYTGLEWNFTTGEKVSTWRIHTAEVELMGMNLSVEVTGKENISVYMVITNVGSFLLEEGSNGTYSLLIPGHEFEYGTSYNYHFSSNVGGPDLVHALSGTFRTPEDPDPEPIWSLDSAEVEVLEGGTWNITAHGGENQSVYIVIEGVGSFLLVEGPVGTYTLLMGAEGFKGGEYPYHFSDEDGGVDLAPGLSGMRTIEPADGGDDGDGPTQWIILLVLLMVIMGLVFVFVMVIRGKGDGADIEGDEE
ncbi:MAG: Ig-like domain-containing protein, partial [Thermoplasmata archaeon]|nr:Ig-like domain-containing protein [Thermoplasmata archaeon]